MESTREWLARAQNEGWSDARFRQEWEARMRGLAATGRSEVKDLLRLMRADLRRFKRVLGL